MNLNEARVHRIEKSRKEHKCSKCGTVIPAGGTYYMATPRYGPKIIRCSKCGLKPYETSGSSFVQAIGALQDHWYNDYSATEEGVQNLSDYLEELKDECEDKLYSMPDHLQDASNAGQMLQERIDMLETAIDELEYIDFETIREDVTDEAMDELRLDTTDDSEIDKDELEELINEKLADRVTEEIENILYELSY